MPLSFQNDIAPIFAPFQEAMRWRFNLLNYENVRANATLIYERISVAETPDGPVPMPPPPFTRLTPTQIATFKTWIDEGRLP